MIIASAFSYFTMLSILFLFCLIHSIVPQNVSENTINFSVPKEKTDQILMYYYNGRNQNDPSIIKLENGFDLTEQEDFDATITTVFYLHGWGENAYNGSSKILISAFLQKKICNLVVFDYSTLVLSNFNPIRYALAAFNVKSIGQAIGEFLKQYITEKQPLDLIRIVSHSLGSQIMSQAAKVYGAGNLRLTALDPARPLFKLVLPHLDATDGKFVDVIHSDDGFLGDDRTVGTADFFPNRGKRFQPGCPESIKNMFTDCSHRRSFELYAESITNPEAFPAKQCHRERVLFSFIKDKLSCNSGDIAYMGYYVNISVHGTYYLETNSESPYGKGIAGIYF